MVSSLSTALLIASALRSATAHIAIWHPSMWGFNVTGDEFPDYDNRPVAPLADYTFDQWWFHGHLAYPPNAGDLFELPAGGAATTELACTKSATSYWASSDGGDIVDPNNMDYPCPGSPISQFHTQGADDVKGCSLAIAYKNDITQVTPADFTVFSVNQTCVWNRFTDFQVPANMPACPPGGCICAWFWIHSIDSGSMQNFMNGFRCDVTGASSTVPLATSQVPRRCGADLDNGVEFATLGNCTYGAKQPFYWFQAEQNNMFEGTYAPPYYNDLYNFRDGAQNDIFQDSYWNIPVPGPGQLALPLAKNLVGGLQLITSDPGETTDPASATTTTTTTSETTRAPWSKTKTRTRTRTKFKRDAPTPTPQQKRMLPPLSSWKGGYGLDKLDSALFGASLNRVRDQFLGLRL